MLTPNTLMPYMRAMQFVNIPFIQILGGSLNSPDVFVWLRSNAIASVPSANEKWSNT